MGKKQSVGDRQNFERLLRSASEKQHQLRNSEAKAAESGVSRKPIKEKVLFVVFNGVALLAFGVAMTGWLNPGVGVLIMALAVLYWLWELLTQICSTSEIQLGIQLSSDA